MFRLIIAAAALVVPAAAAAHSFWLQPADHSPDQGEELRVEFKVGDVGVGDNEAADWGLYWERIVSLRLYGPGGVTDQQSAVRTTKAGEVGGAVVTVPGPGSYILAFESNPSFSDLEAERFDRYVENTSLTAIAADRAARGRSGIRGTELYSRRAKTVLQVGEEQTRNVTRPIGQTLEIVPTENPFSMGEGEQLPLLVLWRGKPLAGALLEASALDGGSDGLGDLTTYRTDEYGTVVIPAQNGSAMLYSVVWGEPAPNDTRADYFTVFASLTVRPL